MKDNTKIVHAVVRCSDTHKSSNCSRLLVIYLEKKITVRRDLFYLLFSVIDYYHQNLFQFYISL